MIRRLLDIVRTTRNDFLNRQELVQRRLNGIQRHLSQLAIMERDRYLKDVLSDPKYDNDKRLERYGFKVYSQNDEDGITQEIFSRIGTTSKTFVEFGVGNGLENNTLTLLLKGCNGRWIEDAGQYLSQIASRFHQEISNGRLR